MAFSFSIKNTTSEQWKKNGNTFTNTDVTSQNLAKFPMMMSDRTNANQFFNLQLTFSKNVPVNLPGSPAPSQKFSQSTVIYKVPHNLGYIPAFKCIFVGYGIGGSNAGFNTINSGTSYSTELQLQQYSTGVVGNNRVVRARCDSKFFYLTLDDEAWSTPDPPSQWGVFNSVQNMVVQAEVQIFNFGVNDKRSLTY